MYVTWPVARYLPLFESAIADTCRHLILPVNTGLLTLQGQRIVPCQSGLGGTPGNAGHACRAAQLLTQGDKSGCVRRGVQSNHFLQNPQSQ